MKSFHMPTKIYSGENCVIEKGKEIASFGKKAVIVTGKTSGVKSGALPDIIDALEKNNTQYCIFDKINNNPSLDNVSEGGEFARQNEADFVIGIGGGSPLDGAKAVAVLGANNMDPEKLYTGEYDNNPLPIVAIPTTAGTGSEVTPFSILTYDKLLTKKSFKSEYIFPKTAFLDARYTKGLPYDITVDTAVDALSHAVEGYLSVFSSSFSDYIALEAIRIFSRNIENLKKGNFTLNVRQELLEMATLAGIVITHARTTIVHAMGYQLTYFNNVPHGRANGLLMGEYLRFNYNGCKTKIDRVLKIMELCNIDEFKELLNDLFKDNNVFTKEDIIKFAKIAIESSSLKNNPIHISYEQMVKLFEDSLKN